MSGGNRRGVVIHFHKDTGLAEWYEQYAEAAGVTPNRAMVTALEEYRAAVESLAEKPVPPHPPMAPLEAPVPPP